MLSMITCGIGLPRYFTDFSIIASGFDLGNHLVRVHSLVSAPTICSITKGNRNLGLGGRCDFQTTEAT